MFSRIAGVGREKIYVGFLRGLWERRRGLGIGER